MSGDMNWDRVVADLTNAAKSGSSGGEDAPRCADGWTVTTTASAAASGAANSDRRVMERTSSRAGHDSVSSRSVRAEGSGPVSLRAGAEPPLDVAQLRDVQSVL